MTATLDTPLPRVDFVVPATGHLAAFGKPKFSKAEKVSDAGVKATVYNYSDVPVFRSGTFSDSMGREREWEPTQMSQMVANFDKLRADGNFRDVPVRKGHPDMFGGSTMDGLVGYITGLRTEVRKSPLASGETYTYLIADYEIIDREAQEKIDSGLWRNRSAEIGMYPTNSPVTEHYPVFMGFAYVDIPAVEGLNGDFSKAIQSGQFSIQTEVPPMTDTAPTPKLPSLTEFKIGGVQTNDYSRVQAYIADVESKNEAFAAQVATLTADNATLRQFKSDAAAAARTDFMKSLVAANKLGANELEAETAFATSLTDDQFTVYRGRMEARQPDPKFGKFGHTGTDAGRSADGGDSQEEVKAAEIAQLSAVVRSLRDHSRMPATAIMQTDSYAKLLVLDPSVTLDGLK